MRHGLLDTLALVAGLVTVAKLDGFVDPGRGARRDARHAARPAFEGRRHLDGRITP